MSEPIELRNDWPGQHCPRLVDGDRKRRWWGRKASAVDTVLVHATAVKGGFGANAQQIAAARERFVRSKLSRTSVTHDYLLENLSEGEQLDELRFDVFLYRFRDTPYHGYYLPQARASVVQWPVTDYTYQGDGANGRSVGWAYDGLFTPSHQDQLDVEGGRESLRHFIRSARSQGAPISRVCAHANHSTKQHDPGPRVWLEVVEPVALELGLEIAADWCTGVGQPWVKRWREAA